LTVDLCSLCARPNDPSVAMFVAAALFADGAAAVVLRGGSMAAADDGNARTARIVAAGEHCWRGTEHIMAGTSRRTVLVSC
jgi:alkylresorcinol/alkylpyrone synthase